jgi:hypothetical protein
MSSNALDECYRYAILDERGNVVPCKHERWSNWAFGGERVVKAKRIGDLVIATTFSGRCEEQDGPARFWRVRLRNKRLERLARAAPTFRAWKAIEIACPKTLEEALESTKRIDFERAFASLEEALQYHAEIRKQITARDRVRRRKPEKAQQLLLKLDSWCSGKRGRQSEVARAVGVGRQLVNDWLAGRKKMTGDEALAVLDFLAKQRRIATRSVKT